MKSKYFFIIIPTILLITIIAILIGCGKKDNPLSANSNAVFDKSAGRVETILPTVLSFRQTGDLDGGTADFQARIFIQFSEPMDESTINSTNITLTRTTGSGDPTNLTYTYLKESRTCIIEGTFPNGSAFVVNINKNVKDLNGNSIDGNGNGKNDANIYDDYRGVFSAGGATADITSPTIKKENGCYNGYCGFPSCGGVSHLVGYKKSDPIRFIFDSGDIDTTTLKNGITITSPTHTITLTYMHNWSSFGTYCFKASDTLRYYTQYTITMNLAEIKDVSNNRVLLLDKLPDNPNNYVIVDVNSVSWTFITEGAPNDDKTPLGVNGNNTYNAGYYYQVRFNDKCDRNTIPPNVNTVQVYDDNGYIPYETILWDYDSKEFRYYYKRSPSANIHIWISKDVKDDAGNFLDGNGNGIGGEEDDNYRK